MRKKITAAFAALALAVTSLFVATSASAVQGDDPSNPIILTSLDDVPAGAVSTGSHMRQCSTVQTWSLTIPGDALIEHPEYRYLREVPAVEEVSHQEYQWSIASRTYSPGQTELTHQVYSYGQVVPTYQTQYQYQMQVQGYFQIYNSWTGNWDTVGTFGWEWWNGVTTQWSFSDVAVLYSGPHSAVQAQWTDSGYQYRKITTAYQFVKNGNAQQVQVGTHMEYTGETTSVLGSPWTLLGGYPHTVIDRPYIAPSFTPWVWDSFTPWQTLTTPPADPDGQDGEANPLNLRKIVEGGPDVYERRVVTTPAVAAYKEYFVYGGPPSLIEANASWVSATQSPSGWVRFDTRVVVDQEATPDVVTYYEYSNGVQCSAVNFDLTGIPPTCSADGGLPGLPETEGYSLAWDREFDGPGTYTLTATADTGYVIEGQTSKDFTVEAATGYQNEDPEVACYVEPPTKDDLVTVVDGTFACNDTTVKTTTTTISYTFTFDSETGTYSAPIAGKPVVVEGVRDLKATERTVCSVPPVPPTLATTGLDTVTVGVMFGTIGILGLGIMVLAGAARLRRSRQEG